jgi:hypothetical protein
VLLADHVTVWDERMGSAAPILMALVLGFAVTLIAWLIRLRKHGLPDQGPGYWGVLAGFVFGLIVWLRLRGETDAFAQLWNGVFLQTT